MLKLPTHPIAQNNRLIEAVCSDLFSRDRDAPMAKAVCEVARQSRNLKGGEK